jgi:hypothetical protein
MRSTLLDRSRLGRNDYPSPREVSTEYLISVWTSGALVGGALSLVVTLFVLA